MNLLDLETNQLKTVKLFWLFQYCYNLSSDLAPEVKSKTRPIIYSFLTPSKFYLTQDIHVLFLNVYSVFLFEFSLNFQIISLDSFKKQHGHILSTYPSLLPCKNDLAIEAIEFNSHNAHLCCLLPCVHKFDQDILEKTNHQIGYGIKYNLLYN